MLAAAAGVPEGADGAEIGSRLTGAALLADVPPGVMDGWLAGTYTLPHVGKRFPWHRGCLSKLFREI
jgi:hypothetical protein